MAHKHVESLLFIVLQKLLAGFHFCITLITIRRMLWQTSLKKTSISVVAVLAEGSSIRSIERMSGIHRDTIMRLGVRVDEGCATLLDNRVRDLSYQYLQLDEILGFIGKKQRHVRDDDDPTCEDVWTFCAIDAETKLVPSFKVGKRDMATANGFVNDLAGRLRNRVQISTDGLRAYVDLVEQSFGADVDYGQIVKTYIADGGQHPERKYSPPRIGSAEKMRIAGNPEMDKISTNYVERLNATTRTHMRRLTRLTLAFSKKRENFESAVALHFAYYDFVKIHMTIRCTPAMAAGVERSLWSVGNLVEAAT